MKQLLESLLALLALYCSGCGPNPQYCSRCETVVSQSEKDERVRLIRGRCTVGGKEIDCTHEHARCPECKHAK